jgi:hypothetical protein
MRRRDAPDASMTGRIAVNPDFSISRVPGPRQENGVDDG